MNGSSRSNIVSNGENGAMELAEKLKENVINFIQKSSKKRIKKKII